MDSRNTFTLLPRLSASYARRDSFIFWRTISSLLVTPCAFLQKGRLKSLCGKVDGVSPLVHCMSSLPLLFLIPFSFYSPIYLQSLDASLTSFFNCWQILIINFILRKEMRIQNKIFATSIKVNKNGKEVCIALPEWKGCSRRCL